MAAKFTIKPISCIFFTQNVKFVAKMTLIAIIQHCLAEFIGSGLTRFTMFEYEIDRKNQ